MTTTKAIGQTLFDKIWERHRIFEREDGQVLLYVDRHFIHDVSQSAFEMTSRRDRLSGRSARRIITCRRTGEGWTTSPIPSGAIWRKR
jgi:homoaconitase/3-isopropylmalate dehydratase large subunit